MPNITSFLRKNHAPWKKHEVLMKQFRGKIKQTFRANI